jgi:hypothetical protein
MGWMTIWRNQSRLKRNAEQPWTNCHTSEEVWDFANGITRSQHHRPWNAEIQFERNKKETRGGMTEKNSTNPQSCCPPSRWGQDSQTKPTRVVSQQRGYTNWMFMGSSK